FQKNDYLAKTALANPTSAQNAIINVAAIGITLNPASKLAYLVPRDGMVCLDISYMGLLHLAQSTGSIKWGQCKLVYSNDTYESNGLDSAPTHKYNAFGERGSIVGGYCTVKTADGDYLTEEMSLAEIKAVEATSKAKNGPWKTFWEE
ncbi:recombinase RecT, partial [Escherichia coli]|nr:recombinase RecT [Escherichia coli]